MSRSIEEVGCVTRRIAALLGCGRRRDIRRALEAAERLVGNNPTWCIAALLLASAQAKSGQRSQAVATLGRARSLLAVGRQLSIRGYTEAVRVVGEAIDAAVAAHGSGSGLMVAGKGVVVEGGTPVAGAEGGAAEDSEGDGRGHEDKEREDAFRSRGGSGSAGVMGET